MVNRTLSLTRGKLRVSTVDIVSKCDYTPWIIVRPEVDGDVMDAGDAGQVHPPGGGLSPI